MTRTAWFNCCAGVAGDMLLGALVDAGASPDDVAAAIAALEVTGYALGFESTQRCGITATRALVVVTGHDHEHEHEHDHDDEQDHEHGHHPHRPAREVIALIEAAPLAPRVAQRARNAYSLLAQVEGQIHGVDPDAVELHEVGALDSIIDVVGVCAALESLGIDRIACSPIAVGHGTVATAHGRLPNPVPAVVHLLARAAAPMVGIDTTMELATPTGVALMAALSESFGPVPTMSVAATGFGAGAADPAGRPNVVQVVVGETADDAPGAPGRPALLVEVNVDDVTGEVIAHTIARALEVGAHDAWATPIVMKKGRPAHVIAVVCDDARFAAVSQVLLEETGSLGIRRTALERWPQRRAEQVVTVDGHAIRVKSAAHRIKIEHDDAADAARALGLPLREVLRRAEDQLRSTGEVAGL